MISSEVQRTLVKSPPELWAELSDPATLARHLGELGEIRITCTDPERAVEWEAEGITGTVLIHPSGWGTKVKLTATREPSEPELPTALGPPAAAATTARAELPIDGAEPTTDAEPDTDAEAPWASAEAAANVPIPADAEPIVPQEPESAFQALPEPIAAAPLDAAVPAEPDPATRRGFFAKLFRRARRDEPVESAPYEVMEAAGTSAGVDEEVVTGEWTPQAHAPLATEVEPTIASEPATDEEPPDETAATSAPTAPTDAEPPDETTARAAPAEATNGHPAEAIDCAGADPSDISAELRAAEEATTERVTAVLTGVLDRLGAAHHRPFSRS